MWPISMVICSFFLLYWDMGLIKILRKYFFTCFSHFDHCLIRYTSQDFPVVHVEFLFGTLLLLTIELLNVTTETIVTFHLPLAPVLNLLLYRMFSVTKIPDIPLWLKIVFNAVNPLLIVLLILSSYCRSLSSIRTSLNIYSTFYHINASINDIKLL